MTESRKTPFYEKHLEHKGKVVDYGGWLLSVQFEGVIAEVLQTRQKAGIFDVSHMGEIMVEGKSALSFLQTVLTNDISNLKDGAIKYSPVCYPYGGTVDDILVYRYNEDKYLLIVNAGNTDKDFKWLQEHVCGDVTLKNISLQTAQVALQGPNSLAILASLTDASLADLAYYHFIPEVKVAGITCLVSRTGYTGEDGYEIYCKNADAHALWDAIWSAGSTREMGLVPVGLGARDVLRLEACLPLYGHELSEERGPIEAGLKRFVSFTKEEDFIGKEPLLRQLENGLKQKLAGLEMIDRGIPREGYIVKSGGEDIGIISSGIYSPTLEKSVAMAFLNSEKAVVGEEVLVAIRSREYRARVVKLPFYRRG